LERLILQSTADGLVMGLLVALVALGLTLQYSIMHILNFAHGDIYMLGGFLCYYLITKAGINYFLALPIVMVALFLFGIILERAIFRPVRGSHWSFICYTGCRLAGFRYSRQNCPVTHQRYGLIRYYHFTYSKIGSFRYLYHSRRSPILAGQQNQDRTTHARH
jgi:ABC-type branched-subunit amino acid transport system permease subunit